MSISDQKKTDINLPIWVLNLERDKEKRQFMEEQLKQLGVEYQIIKAVDGKNLTADDLAHYSKKTALRDFGRELTTGELGCALSHIKMWQSIVERNLAEVLILEDDAHLGRGLFDVLAHRDKLPEDYQHINFSTRAKQIPFGEFITDIYRASTHAERPYSAFAYLLTKEGAKYLLDIAFPIYMPIDNFVSISGIKSYGIFPSVVVLSDLKSSIGRRWDDMPEPSFFLRKFRQFKDILKAMALFLGFSKESLVKIHLRLNNLLGKFKKKA
jgi:glycosyl transferase family 25